MNFYILNYFIRIIIFICSIISIHDVFAVHLSHDGRTGQVLIFPYYHVSDSSISYMSIFNSRSNHGKVLKIRFLDSMTGKPTGTANLYLNSFQDWSGTISLNNEGEVKFQSDKNVSSCLVQHEKQLIPRQGFIEVLEMGVSSKKWDSCKDLKSQIQLNGEEFLALGLTPPSGGVLGALNVFQNSNQLNLNIKPVVLDGWRDSAFFTPSGNVKPDLSDAHPLKSIVFSNSIPSTQISHWKNSYPGAAVSAVLMANEINLDYSSIVQANFKTNYLLLFPIKYYFDQQRGERSCVDVQSRYFDQAADLRSLSITSRNDICSVQSIFKLQNEDVIDSEVEKIAIDVDQLSFGFAKLKLSGKATTLVSDEGHVYRGTPAIGIGMQTMGNNVIIKHGSKNISLEQLEIKTVE